MLDRNKPFTPTHARIYEHVGDVYLCILTGRKFKHPEYGVMSEYRLEYETLSFAPDNLLIPLDNSPSNLPQQPNKHKLVIYDDFSTTSWPCMNGRKIMAIIEFTEGEGL